MNSIQFNESGTGVITIDQSLLPNEEKYIELTTPEEMHEAIKKLRVRGAPAIGIFAGYALAALAKQQATCCDKMSCDEMLRELAEKAEYLKSSRPTAVNLAWAADRIMQAAAEAEASAAEIAEAFRREAITIHQEDIAMCTRISEFGIEEIRRIQAETCSKNAESDNGNQNLFGILTHCNAGPLATSEYGTALGPIILGHEEGMMLRVFADETRPLLQGARLTTYELHKRGIDVTLICDNMASTVMKNGWVQAVFVGCDRVAANGDAANKIGTSGVAILAKHYGIPFYVLGPSSTIDSNCPTGADIPIEERDPEEIREMFYEKPMAPDGIRCFNPSFDVTDHELITAIITEKGIFRPPYSF